MAIQLYQGSPSNLFPNPGVLGADSGHSPPPLYVSLQAGGPTAGEPGQSPDPERVERAPTRKRSGVALSFRHSAGTALCHLEISPSPKPIAVCRVVRKVATAKPPFAGQIAHGQWCEVASSGNVLVLIC